MYNIFTFRFYLQILFFLNLKQLFGQFLILSKFFDIITNKAKFTLFCKSLYSKAGFNKRQFAKMIFILYNCYKMLFLQKSFFVNYQASLTRPLLQWGHNNLG